MTNGAGVRAANVGRRECLSRFWRVVGVVGRFVGTDLPPDRFLGARERSANVSFRHPMGRRGGWPDFDFDHEITVVRCGGLRFPAVLLWDKFGKGDVDACSSKFIEWH